MPQRAELRDSVKYAFAARTVRALQVILIAVVFVTVLLLGAKSGNYWQLLFVVETGLLLAFAIQQAGARAGSWIDRRFFREAYDAEQVLKELARSVPEIRDRRMLLQTVARRLAEALNAEPIIILLERTGGYELAFNTGNIDQSLKIANTAATLRHLQRLQSPAKLDFDDPQSWVHGLPDQERRILGELRARVLIPITADRRITGLISLGWKRSAASYSRGDLQMLAAVGAQTGLALENARLNDDIRAEIAARERLNRELEIAREVQQRLFPQVLPIVHGLDFAGYCRPASGVGGDYYDFIRLDDGSLGIAIGDVSGKGIAAALTMASLQASLRGQTIKPCETLSEMVQHVNRLVFEASAANRYATFFYAQYEAEQHRLRFVNAGHNAPILKRGLGPAAELMRLEEGGTVVGLFAQVAYQEASIAVQGGDVLVAFTDGITEALNEAGEEWGEEPLLEMLRRQEYRSAADLITAVLEQVDLFTTGTPQHDDMTLLVVRVR